MIYLICWIIMICFVLVEYAEDIAEADIPAANKILVGIILIIGAPIMCFYSIIDDVLNILLPEGWDDNDDNDKFKH